MVEASGAITWSASAHTIEVTFFEAGGGEGLEVRYQGPGISKQLIPNSAFLSSGVAVTGVSVSPAPSSVMIGKTTQLTATVAPANATNKLVTWSTSNGAVASVNSSGLVSVRVQLILQQQHPMEIEPLQAPLLCLQIRNLRLY